MRVVIDLHAGGREASFPLCTSLHPIPDPAQRAETLEVARLFDTPFVYVYSRQMASGLLTDEAEDEGKIAVGGEFGFGEGSNVRGIRHAYEGVRNVLRHYGMLTGRSREIDPRRAPRAAAGAGAAPRRLRPLPDEPRIWEPVVEPGAGRRARDSSSDGCTTSAITRPIRSRSSRTAPA